MRLHDTQLPGFVRPEELIRRAAFILRPPASIKVSECAEKHVRLNNPGSYVGAYRNSMAPFLVEPMDRAISRSIDELHFVAPSQVGKTQVFLNVIAHAIKYKPADILLVQPTKDLALDFAERRIQKKMLDVSPDLAGELGTNRGDDKVFTKVFKNGSILSIAWPTGSQLASRPIPLVIFDELDRMPDDINGEGDAITLGRNRKKRYLKNGSLINVSSPSKGFGNGVVGYFYEGDQCLWFWPCPSCGEYWSPGFDFARKPTFDHLGYDRNATPQEARYNCWLICPHCGAVIDEKQKGKMNDAGVWLALGQSIDADGNISGAPPNTRIASHWLSGLVPEFVSLGEITEKYLKGIARFEKHQDETVLKAVTNTDFGFPYISRRTGAAPIEITELEKHRRDYAMKTVPEGVRYLLAAVDVGTRKFDVLVQGYDEDGRSWLIDRYTLKSAADGRPLDPPNILSDWKVLRPLIFGRYPLAKDPDKFLPVGAVVCDTGGAAGEDEDGNVTAGVPEMARDFARGLHAEGVKTWRFVLIKGASVRTAPILPQRPTLETDDNGKALANGVSIYVIGVHILKNITDTQLRLTKDQAGYPAFPRDVPEAVFKELTAEQKVKGKWVRNGPNESFDLYGYAAALRQKMKPDRVNWETPPPWGKIVTNDEVVADPATQQAAKKPMPRVRSKGISWRD